MNRSELLKLMYKFNRIFNKLNQYFYILPLISILTNIFNNKYINKVNKLIKVVIFINIVLGVSLIILFTDLITPLNTTYSIYSDIIEPYIELIQNLWNQLINYINTHVLSAGPVNPEIDLTNIQSEIKEGIKQGVKEAISEVIEEMRDELQESQGNSELIKQFALVSSGIFFIYFIFILPGSSISPVELTQYNWLNQSLIELKINIINLLFNPGNPGNPGSPINSPINSPITNIQTLTEYVDAAVSPISPCISESSLGVSTVTPNSPVTLYQTVDAFTQTELSGIEFSRFVKANQIVGENLPEATQNKINSFVTKVITKISD